MTVTHGARNRNSASTLRVARRNDQQSWHARYIIALGVAIIMFTVGALVPAVAQDTSSGQAAPPQSTTEASPVTLSSELQENTPLEGAAPEPAPVPAPESESEPSPPPSTGEVTEPDPDTPDASENVSDTVAPPVPDSDTELTEEDLALKAETEGADRKITPAATGPIITVHAGGIRTGTTSVTPLANGATFVATPVSGSPTGGPFTCTITDGTGTCQINVPSNYRWDVKMSSVPGGYYLNPTLDFGSSSTVASDTYSFRTGIVTADIDVPGPNANGTYQDVRHAGNNYFGGLLASSLNNPSVATQCGVDVALVLDQSGSMSGTKQSDLKVAANDTVNALTGTPSKLAIYTFSGSTGPSIGATSTATSASAQSLHDFINGLGNPNGYTNWDAGIYQVPAGFDLAIVLTDGAPTTSSASGTSSAESYFKYVEHGIFSANHLKSLGTRVVGLGVGINGAEANLRSISGATAGSDYYLASTSNFDDILRELAAGACSSQLTIQKQVIDPSGAPVADTALANDWTFTNTITEGTIDSTVTTGVVNDQNGFATASVSLDVGATPSVTVTETVKPGYTLTSAQCTVAGAPVDTQLSGNTASFVGAADQPMACTFVNQQAPESWTLEKTADPTSGTDVNELQDVVYTLTATNSTGVPVLDAVATDDLTDVLDNGTLGALAAGLSQSGNTLTWNIGTLAPQTSVSISFTVTVNEGAGGKQLVNTVAPGDRGSCLTPEACRTTHPIQGPEPVLTLEKTVLNEHGGTAASTDWTLTASGPTPITGTSGDSAVTSATVSEGEYTLSETSNLGSQYQWSELECEIDGKPIVGVNTDSPMLSLSRGDRVICTFTNSDLPAALTLQKIVDNNDANTQHVPSDFTLSAKPVNINGQGEVTGNGDPGSTGGVKDERIFAGTYQLSETGPAGFAAGVWQCAGGTLEGDLLTVMNGEIVECRITNTALDPILTLVKVVDNGDTGGRSTIDDWTLIADGTSTGGSRIWGTSGTPAVTTAFVPVGTYQLGETGDPVGYSPSDWVCDNGDLGTEVVLGIAEEATCTLTNTATATSWAVQKTSDPQSGSSVMPGDTITYTVELSHLGGIVPTSETLTDDLSDVLDDATWGGVSVTSGEAQLSGDVLTWTTGEVSESATMTYTVVVDADAYNQTLRNVVTPPPGSECQTECFTEHFTPHFVVSKTSEPVTGSVVNVGDTVTYTLTAHNDSLADLTGAFATDDLSDVLEHATLNTPLADGLTFDEDQQTLRWELPDLDVGGDAITVQYSVNIDQDAAAKTLTNVVTPGMGGDCMRAEPTLAQVSLDGLCSATVEVRNVDLDIVKSHNIPDPVGTVESGNGSVITYELEVRNLGEVSPRDDAVGVTVTDTLPAGLTFDLANIVAPDWDLAGTTDTELRATYIANDGVFASGSSSTLKIPAFVGLLDKVVGQPYPDIVNEACVNTQSPETNDANNCSTDSVSVRWVELDPVAKCYFGVPAVDYDIPVRYGALPPVITMIWWTAQGYTNRDQTIPASDTEALLADGAQLVTNIPIPSDWTDGQSVVGMELWPGSGLDAQSNPVAWPGWTQRTDGTWYLNPEAPFYAIYDEAYVEVRVSTALSSEYVVVNVPSGCNPQNPASRTSWLSRTGNHASQVWLLSLPLLALGYGLVRWGRQKKSRV